MLKAAGREKEGWLDITSIETFPCADLRTIDRLWVKYSDGRFGFSVQKRIWEGVGGKPGENDDEIYCKLGVRVGWRVKEEWLYPDDYVNPPEGHLPLVVGSWLFGGFVVGVIGLVDGLPGSGMGVGCDVFSSLTSRLVKCNI